MSEVPRARDYLHRARRMHKAEMSSAVYRLIGKALSYMTRRKQVRRAPPVRRPVTPLVRKGILQLAPTTLTMTQIARRVGLRNGGRVSEVLNPKKRRKRK